MAIQRPEIPLTNAPVEFVLAAVHFKAEPTSEQTIERLRSKLKQKFTRYEKIYENHVKLDPESTGEIKIKHMELSSHLYLNESRSKGFIINNQFFGFIESVYIDFDAYSKEFNEIFSIVVEELGFSYCKRIGIRYIDLIYPAADKSVYDYVEKELLAFNPGMDSILKRTSHNITEYKTDCGGTLRLQSTIRSGNSGIPEDLMPVMSKFKLKVRETNKPFVRMDTDHFVLFEEEKPVNLNELNLLLNNLHTICGDLFFKAVTDEAIEEWK